MLRHLRNEVPLIPGETRELWTVEARVSFDAVDPPLKASLAIPDARGRYEIVEEFTASPGYGLNFIEIEPGMRRAEWTKREGRGRQTLYYRANLLLDELERPLGAVAPSRPVSLSDSPEDQLAASILALARERSADATSLTRELIEELNRPSESQELLLNQASRINWLERLLGLSGINATSIGVLNLEDGRRRQTLETWLLIDPPGEESADVINIDTGVIGLARDQIIWEAGARSLLDIIGGQNSQVSFSTLRQEIPATPGIVAFDNSAKAAEFSVHALPVSEQALFKNILLIPVGVLLVVFFRVIIGVRTSGTFMPVLIAIAFLQTSLATGLTGFLLILAIGLALRGYLSRLNLLLVARISTVIVMVIAIIAVLAILAFKLGWTEGLKITLFPMIILSWTIERMSILWEEEGAGEVMRQGGGSLLLAIVCYFAMSSEMLRHLTFNFLGVQLIILGLILLMGAYTGYRLVELKRFSSFQPREKQARHSDKTSTAHSEPEAG